MSRKQIYWVTRAGGHFGPKFTIWGPLSAFRRYGWGGSLPLMTVPSLQAMWGGGAFGWQLRVSQLNLQPPLGVTVPDIADWLSQYFDRSGREGEEIYYNTRKSS